MSVLLNWIDDASFYHNVQHTDIENLYLQNSQFLYTDETYSFLSYSATHDVFSILKLQISLIFSSRIAVCLHGLTIRHAWACGSIDSSVVQCSYHMERITSFDWLTNTFSSTLKLPMRAVLIIYTVDEIKQTKESQKRSNNTAANVLKQFSGKKTFAI